MVYKSSARSLQRDDSDNKALLVYAACASVSRTNSHNDSLPPRTENRAAYSGHLLNHSATDGLSGGMQGTAQGRVNFNPTKGTHLQVLLF